MQLTLNPICGFNSPFVTWFTSMLFVHSVHSFAATAGGFEGHLSSIDMPRGVLTGAQAAIVDGSDNGEEFIVHGAGPSAKESP